MNSHILNLLSVGKIAKVMYGLTVPGLFGFVVKFCETGGILLFEA